MKQINAQCFFMHDQQSSTYEFTRSWLKSSGFEPYKIIEVNSSEVIKTLVKKGLGIAVLPKITILNEIQTGSLYFKELDEVKQRSIYLVYNKERYMLPIIKTLIRQITQNEISIC